MDNLLYEFIGRLLTLTDEDNPAEHAVDILFAPEVKTLKYYEVYLLMMHYQNTNPYFTTTWEEFNTLQQVLPELAPIEVTKYSPGGIKMTCFQYSLAEDDNKNCLKITKRLFDDYLAESRIRKLKLLQ